MPIALDPHETFELSTARDREGYDLAARPVFICHYLTGGEWREYLAVLSKLEAFYAAPPADRDGDEHERVMLDLYRRLGAQMVGWRHVRDRRGDAIPFDGARLQYVLTDAEAIELFREACRMSDLGGPEKNVSDSPSPGSSEPSAAAGAPTAPVAAPRA